MYDLLINFIDIFAKQPFLYAFLFFSLSIFNRASFIKFFSNDVET